MVARFQWRYPHLSLSNGWMAPFATLQFELLTDTFEPMIQRDLVHRGFLAENRGYDARLVGWVEVL